MNNNNLFSQHQFGFRNKTSCILQLLTILDDWTLAFSHHLSKHKEGFWHHPHHRLIKKLQGNGIEGNILEWIKDFLKDRKQRVCVDNNFSEWKEITSGIPQGSMLGPILFIIYINDLPDAIESTCKNFPDYTKIYKRI